MRGASAGVVVAAIIDAAVLAGQAGAQGFEPVEIRANPLDQLRLTQAAARYEGLEPRGALVLSSPDPRFGSWSGLDFGGDGTTFYAVSDDGLWLTGRIVEEEGRLTGIAGAMLAPMLDATGQPIEGDAASDAEGLRILDNDGVMTALISFERGADVRAFAATPDLATALASRFVLPIFVHGMPANQGLESIAVAPADSALAGAIVLVAERSLNLEHNHRAFIVNGPRNGPFAIRRTDEFDITDAAFLPDGDLLILERRFRITEGFAMRIRRIAAASIDAGATVDGQVLIQADVSDRIDNMEGIAVTVRDGETLLTLISDDNHNFLQHTIMARFAVTDAVPPLPRLRPATVAAIQPLTLRD
jgi:hypothetical protein